MERKIGLVTILTDKIGPMKEFYNEILGFPIIEDLGNYVEFHNPGVRFALCKRETMYKHTEQESYLKKPGGQLFELAIPAGDHANVDYLYHEFVSRGAKPIKQPEIMPWGRKTGFIADPDGNIHEIYSDPVK